MKKRPIIFSGAMVRAILEGRKMMTRRVVKPQPELTSNAGFLWKGRLYGNGFTAMDTARNFSCSCCHYGQPGDRLWVRETWGETESGTVCYRADEPLSIVFKWHHSIYMPREVSRIMLEITDIRVERLQDISREDAKKEGFWPSDLNGLESWNGKLYGNANLAFEACWDSINGKKPGRSWADNPWVWVISFKRIGG